MLLSPFAPNVNASAEGFVASTTASVVATAATSALPTNTQNSPHLQIANQGSVWCFINVGSAAVPAATVAASYPIAPGSVVVISVNPGATSVSTIATAAGPSPLTFTRGEGM
jgi:hypothetical protein